MSRDSESGHARVAGQLLAKTSALPLMIIKNRDLSLIHHSLTRHAERRDAAASGGLSPQILGVRRLMRPASDIVDLWERRHRQFAEIRRRRVPGGGPTRCDRQPRATILQD